MTSEQSFSQLHSGSKKEIQIPLLVKSFPLSQTNIYTNAVYATTEESHK
jgi:hypothetical protein